MLNGMGMNYEQGWGVSKFDSSTKLVNLTTNYTPQYNGPYPIPTWPDLRKEQGDFAVGYGGYGGDHHISIRSVLRPFSPLTCNGFTSTKRSKPPSSRTFHTGRQYCPVDSITISVTSHFANPPVAASDLV